MFTGKDLLERPVDGRVRCPCCGDWIELRVVTSIAEHPECGCFFFMRATRLQLHTHLGTMTTQEFIREANWYDKDSGERVGP